MTGKTESFAVLHVAGRSSLPVNILMRSGCLDHKTLASLGVARISHGHGPWAAAMDWLQSEAAKTFAAF